MSASLVGWVFKNSPYKGPFLLIHLAVADTVDDRMELRVSQRWLADKARVSRNTVARFVEKATTDGILEPLTSTVNRAQDYKLVAHGWATPVAHGYTTNEQPVAHQKATSGSDMSQKWLTGGSRVAHMERDTTATTEKTINLLRSDLHPSGSRKSHNHASQDKDQEPIMAKAAALEVLAKLRAEKFSGADPAGTTG